MKNKDFENKKEFIKIYMRKLFPKFDISFFGKIKFDGGDYFENNRFIFSGFDGFIGRKYVVLLDPEFLGVSKIYELKEINHFLKEDKLKWKKTKSRKL